MTLNLETLKIEIMSVYALTFKQYIKEDTLDSMVWALIFFLIFEFTSSVQT